MSLLHKDVRLDVEQQVIIVPAHLQQKGCLLLQRPLQVGGARQRLAVQLDDDVAILEASSVDTVSGRGQLDSVKRAKGRSESRRTYLRVTGARLRARKSHH